MPKPEKIVIDYKLANWAIEYGVVDVGDVGPDYVPRYRAIVSWQAEGSEIRGSMMHSSDEKLCETFSDAVKFIEEETGLKYA